MKRIILDCDTGVDDALALLLAMRSPELSVAAITTVSGNTTAALAARNTLLTLALLGEGPFPPVARGETAPLERGLVTAAHVHGGDGLGGITKLRDADGSRRYPEPAPGLDPRDGPDLILDTVGRFPDAITLIATGPLTNVARTIIRSPARMRRVKELIVMGGAFRVYGNTTPVAEFNIFADPHAAQLVLDFGLPLTLVPLDVTESVCLMRPEVEALAEGAPLARFVRDVTREYTDYHARRDGFPGCYLHDPITVALAIDPTLLESAAAFVQVETTGDVTLGQTVADLRPGKRARPNARVCTAIDAERFLALFRERVMGTE
ncbi:MAG: nucleoside hydrolase [Armatimonadetes bacterium]|nr:nucleoside hydrolase [Armatimonadota bacterium]